MPVSKDASGKRSVQVEVAVPGTPDEVWRAIATGPGISSWFVPSQVEERVGGVVNANFGPGMDSVSVVTEWNPPHHFVCESRDLGPDAPVVVTEWSVEPRAAGVCGVRVTHSVVASSDAWDHAMLGWEYGWPAFFRILNLYLTHYSGQDCSALQLMGVASPPASKAWADFATPLGINGAQTGERCSTRADAPPLAGVVDYATSGDYSELLVRLDAPAPGIAHLFALPMGPQVFLPVRLYLYGKEGMAAATRAESLWRRWLDEHFPAMPPASGRG